MTESQRLWEKYSKDQNRCFECGGSGFEYIEREDLDALLSDYSPWISDREPTVEDGDAYGYVFIRRPNGTGLWRHDKIGWDEFKEFDSDTEWMRIPK